VVDITSLFTVVDITSLFTVVDITSLFTVVDITSLFTVLDTDQARVYIPNNTVLRNVIKQYKQQKP
jgi:hypothetical protein